MPIYEYRCKACGYEKEYLQRMTDAPLTDCPQCGKRSFDKLISAAGFQLKGSGWYVTDFKNKDKGTSTSKETPKQAEGKKDESKPAPAAGNPPASS